MALYEALAPAQFAEFVRDAPIGARARRGELPAPLMVPGAPPELARAIARGLELDPARRWPAMTDLLAALARAAAPPPRARGWRWGLTAGAAVGLLIGVGHGIAADERGACDRGAAWIATTWGEPQRAQLRARVTSIGLGFAADTAARLEALLDGYARTWQEVYHATCEAHRGGQMSATLLDRIMVCLEVDRGALAGLVAGLVELDAAGLDRATSAALRLPELARCRDTEALLAEVPPPIDPSTRLAVLAVEARLTAARSQWYLGRIDDAAGQFFAALPRAQAIGHAPLIAQALHHVGDMHKQRDERAAAEAMYPRSAWLAMEVGDDERLGLVAAGLALTIALPGDRWPEARMWTRLALATTSRIPRGRARFHALHASGGVEYAAGEFLAAEQWYAQAAAHGAQHFGRDSELTLAATAMLATTLGRLGRHEASLAQFDAVLAGQAQVYGPKHPSVAIVHNNRAVTLREADRPDEALAGFATALEIWSAAFGPDHPDVGLAHGNIASALLARGRPDDYFAAEEHLRRAIATLERNFGPGDPDLAVELANLAVLHMSRLELDEAERLLARALQIRERTVGIDHPLAAIPLLVLAELHGLRSDFATQRRILQRLLRALERAYGPAHANIASTLIWLADAELHDGALDLAEVYVTRAASLSVGDPELERACDALRGRLALRRGDAVTASELLARSLHAREGQLFEYTSADLAGELARALLAAGRPAEARPLVERALAYFRGGGAALEGRVAELEVLRRDLERE